jgi:hypothetical protein
LQRSLQLLLEHLGQFERRVKVETWNGTPVLESDGLPLLEAVGLHRAYPAMEWEKKF